MEDKSIHVTCENCGKKYRIKNPNRQKQYTCGECKEYITLKPTNGEMASSNPKNRGNDMNILQRIVLILGAIVMLIVLIASPESESYKFFYNVILREIVIIAITWLIWFALKGIKK